MKRLSFYILFIFIILASQGCDLKDVVYSHDIRIVNDTRYNFSVYLDDAFQFTLESGSSATIEDVEEGYHTIEARVWGVAIASRTVNLYQNIEWTVSE